MAEGIRLHIDALDKLLGLDKMPAEKGIPCGSIVLLRGGPGTGKTILALQILDRLLGSEQHAAAIYVTLELHPGQITAYRNAFGLTTLNELSKRQSLRWKVVDRKTAIQAFADVTIPARLADVDSLSQETLELIAKKLELKPEADKPLVIVIDSLNVLVTYLRGMQQGGRDVGVRDYRTAVQVICTLLKKLVGPAVVILIGEYDPQNLRAVSVAAESFFCDVDIQLAHESASPEGRSVAEARPSERRGTAGEPGSAPAVGTPPEQRLFARVLKFRGGANQDRRCAYEIVDGKGLVFYERYPGDGQMLVFYENAAQGAVWKDLFENDLAGMYPGLAYSSFTRSGLQRVFASIRGFRHVPERTPMYLSSFDTYWVRWYVELCQRSYIADCLKCLPCHPENTDDETQRTVFCQIACLTHRCCLDALSDPTRRNELLNEVTTYVEQCSCNRGSAQALICAQRLEEPLNRAVTYVSDEKGRAGLLQPLSWKDLRLFGERRSQIISELWDDDDKKTRLLCVPAGMACQPGQPLPDKAKLIGVPYDANIGFVVYRVDIWKNFVAWLKKEEDHKTKLKNAIRSVYEKQQADLENALSTFHGIPEHLFAEDATQEPATLPPLDDTHLNTLVDSLKEGTPPQTWEEVVAICMLESVERRRKLHFLIETQTYDTYLAMFMEVLWGCGGDRLRVTPEYKFRPGSAHQFLFEALNLLDIMFSEGTIPRNCSLEPRYLQEHFTPNTAKWEDKTKSKDDTPDWMFARHWYSTLVDTLTARDQERGHFIWEPGEIEIELMPIPVSLATWLRNKGNPKHRSCWGEWYLGLMKGSENEALAADLVNNLMSSQKVCERAFRCASVPTVEEFYKRYGNRHCVDVFERHDMGLPQKTFADMRTHFFADAMSRTMLFDYRHTVRELHAVLEYVHQTGKLRPTDLAKSVVDAMCRINSLAKLSTLIH